MTAKQLSRAEAMPEDETERKPPRLPLPTSTEIPERGLWPRGPERRVRLRA